MTFGDIGQSVKSVGSSAGISFADRDSASVALGGLQVKVGVVIEVISVVLALIYFLPLFKVSLFGMSLNFNGWNATFGKTLSILGDSQKIDGNFAAILLLLVPFAVFAVVQFRPKLGFLAGKLFWTTASLSVVGFVILMVLRAIVSSTVNQEDNYGLLTADYSGWYYFSIILYLVLAAGSIMCAVVGAQRTQPTGNWGIPPSGGNPYPTFPGSSNGMV